MAGTKKSPVKSKAKAPSKPAKKVVAPKKVTASKPVKTKPKPAKVESKTSRTTPLKTVADKKAKTPKGTATKGGSTTAAIETAPAKPGKIHASASFLKKQKERLLALKDTLLDSMNGVARDSLRSRAEGSEASAFGMHQADAGSDAYDRDFALSLLSQEQDSLYEINEALKRIEVGQYGMCEMSNKPIPHARLEALPFTRYTVECQADLEKRNRFQRVRQPVTSLFGLNDEGEEDSEEDSSDSKD